MYKNPESYSTPFMYFVHGYYLFDWITLQRESVHQTGCSELGTCQSTSVLAVSVSS